MSVIVLPLAYLAIYLYFRRLYTCFRTAVLASAIVWGTILTIATELLSLIHMITFETLLAVWLITAAVFISLLLFNRESRTQTNRRTQELGGRIQPLIPAISLLMVVTAYIAWIAPPNNYDSMTYHMSRVMHWIQNGSVLHFPTHIQRQIHQNPGAEFVILHVQLLSGSDQFVNFIQWTSLIGCMLGTSLIAARLGAGPMGQTTAAVLSCSLPMAILQSSTTQNDLIAGFWFICLIVFILQPETDKRVPFRLASWLVGAATGLALLTKGTSYLFCAPVILWYAIREFRRHHRKSLPFYLLVASVAIGINAGHFTRNASLYQNPLGPGGESNGHYRYANDRFGVGPLVSNVMRNFVLEITLPVQTSDRFLEKRIRQAHHWLGLNPDDPETTFTNEMFHITGKFWNSENQASNPIHFMILLIASGAAICFRKSTHPNEVILSACLITSFLLFSFYLRWQPWHSRLLLPLLIAGSAISARFLEKRMHAVAIQSLLVILILIAGWASITCPGRPMTGSQSILSMPREDQYFISMPVAGPIYKRLASDVVSRKAGTIGLILGENDFEYPFWVMLRNRGSNARITHFAVNNISADAIRSTPVVSPDLVVHIEGRKSIARIESP